MQWYKRLSRDKDKILSHSAASPPRPGPSSTPSPTKTLKATISPPPTAPGPRPENIVLASSISTASSLATIATFGSLPSPSHYSTPPPPPTKIPPRTSSTGHQNTRAARRASTPATTTTTYNTTSFPPAPSSTTVTYRLAHVPESATAAPVATSALQPSSSPSPSTDSSVSGLAGSASSAPGPPRVNSRARSRSQSLSLSLSLSYSHSRSQSYTSHSRSHPRSAQPFVTQTMPPPPPPPDPSRYATEDLDFTGRKLWTPEKEKAVCGPFDYLYAHPGKDFRAQLIRAFDVWLEVPAESLAIITQVVGMLHTASLLIDDVEDSSSLRRGLPVAHNIFGVAQTINSANYIYFQALQEVQRLRSPNAISIFADEMLHLHRGQGMDLFWRDNLTCPSEEDYLEMVGNKTGGLFRLGIKLMQAESRSLVDCVSLVNLVGLIFQIRDDYLNLSSREYSHNKGLCEDLTEGKFSFPIIHAIRADPANTQLINILRQKTTDVDVKRYAVSYMESMGSFVYTRSVVNVLIERARKLAFEIDDGRGKTANILAILDAMVLPSEAAENGPDQPSASVLRSDASVSHDPLPTPPLPVRAMQAMAAQQEQHRDHLDKLRS
ncbi:Geranylgeranyl pyrophosphate synthase [Ceratocystis fimbriata CBS 114723]|uniref:Geranylgeranyl pyrophosphate synthase n=2 Tax=Ceratocystis TaxID=5157 RepID=A0A2C5WX05_9PEZI|nr:Geranylgeranyl pyrophosphate synthase [Ceratocystis fimbriata CBS 114723]